MKSVFTLAILLAISNISFSQTITDPLLIQGGKIYGQDPQNTFLGSITNQADRDSIFSQAGPYGNSLSNTSIWNELSPFGVETGKYSAFNELSKTPPKIVKDGNVIGYITKNQTIRQRISPRRLKSMRDQFVSSPQPLQAPPADNLPGPPQNNLLGPPKNNLLAPQNNILTEPENSI